MLSAHALDTYVAPELSKFTALNAPETPQWDKSWLRQFQMNAMLRVTVAERAKQLMVAYLRKVEAALEDSDAARNSTLDYFTSQQTSRYFRGLRHFENCVAMAYQATLAFRSLFDGPPLFKKAEESVFRSLNEIYNDSKHIDGALDRGDYPHPQATVIIWLTNDGLKSERTKLTFVDLHTLLKDEASMADKVALVPGTAEWNAAIAELFKT